jgi:hypothetical protein
VTGPTGDRPPTDEELENLAQDRANDVDDDAADWLAEDEADRFWRNG